MYLDYPLAKREFGEVVPDLIGIDTPELTDQNIVTQHEWGRSPKILYRGDKFSSIWNVCGRPDIETTNRMRKGLELPALEEVGYETLTRKAQELEWDKVKDGFYKSLAPDTYFSSSLGFALMYPRSQRFHKVGFEPVIVVYVNNFEETNRRKPPEIDAIPVQNFEDAPVMSFCLTEGISIQKICVYSREQFRNRFREGLKKICKGELKGYQKHVAYFLEGKYFA
ncbi:MAG TPA: hypothetical protein ENN60_01255 [archaeon]|nr:hypothetical protein [archaeon]